MSEKLVEVERPDRWDHPLSDEMSPEWVSWLLEQPPFSEMSAERFARSTPLADVLRNDARVLNLDEGDVVFREGQYGGSAYLVLDGSVRVSLSKLLPANSSQSKAFDRNRWLSWLSIRRYTQRNDRRDSRRRGRRAAPANALSDKDPEIDYRGSGSETRIFLQDVPGVLDEYETSQISVGELFGEMAAVTRSPREYTAFAESKSVVLEIRWQGLKLLRQDPAFKALLDERYRSEVLKNHLRETELLRFIPEESMERIVAATRFESFGNLEWYAEYRKKSNKTAQDRIESEPLIAEEGSYATGLWIVRGGFGRLSRRQGAGHRTLAYLGKGKMFGLAELVHNFNFAGKSAPLPYQESLRAIGYVDALCIPKLEVVEHVLPFVRTADLPPLIDSPRYEFGQPVVDAPLDDGTQVETGLLEFLVERRLMNGERAMVIDTERCTRCDDCVRACASTHGGTPVFERKGPQYGPWMFAHACMHCEDPVCMIGCPTGAIHRDASSGLVEINDKTCIGCSGCAQSCPYDNIRMVTAQDERGRAKVDQKSGLPILRASKCDLCSSSNSGPACQTACPHDALVRLDLSNPDQLGKWTHGRRD
ncbi:MAG: 4Fe-4S dicluster domain-containing protein [Pirellulaceae bacterium]